MRGLIHLPSLTSEDATSMRVFYDKVVGHTRSIESMGEKYNAEILAPVLVPLIVDKLLKKLVEKWELEIGDMKEDCLPIKTLFSFLGQIIRAKESSTQAPNVDHNPPKSGLKAGFPKNTWFKRSSTSSLCSSTQTEEKVCAFCSKDHNVCSCINFLSMTVKKRF